MEHKSIKMKSKKKITKPKYTQSHVHRDTHTHYTNEIETNVDILLRNSFFYELKQQK